MKTFNFTLAVTTNADVSAEKVAELLTQLIDMGLVDATKTIESGEGDITSAELATDLNISAVQVAAQETSVKVKHWDAYRTEGTVNTHQFDIADQRDSNGQAYITVGALEGGLDDLLSVTMEVNTNPLNGIDHVPCAHVHFDSDSVAVSLFKIGDKILVRPETDVSIKTFHQEINGFGETLYWIK